MSHSAVNTCCQYSSIRSTLTRRCSSTRQSPSHSIAIRATNTRTGRTTFLLLTTPASQCIFEYWPLNYRITVTWWFSPLLGWCSTVSATILSRKSRIIKEHLTLSPTKTCLKHIETDNLEELLQWASGKETIEIFVRDMSHNVAAKNNVIRDKRILELAQQNSMDQIYRLDNMTYQNVARQTRNALQSQFQKTGRGAAGSQVQNYGSYGSSGSPSHFIVGGNAKELISSSSLDHRIEEEDEYVSSVRDDAILSPANDSESGQFDGLSFDSAMSRRRQKGLEDAVRKVRNIAREQRITVTYGVSDSDIRRLIDRLQTRGVDAVQTDEDRN
ncbi:hypothetical protein BOX15_Mlig025738g1 [Macrostomum lignano]|uniref:Uncharacterized protein n=1 Tax=Macrostomum lignano TaxID=282301 RepID=A0A267FAZ7_9PLAT|nr:hypothetical protein BOX15_Mlig025738g1 [Macrostomum lignano]